jgi:alcohol dehydrogenase class IV
MPRTVTAPFAWQDGERLICFGRGTAAGAVERLGGPGYELLTTERAAAMAPHVAEDAAAVHIVGAGRVDELAGALLGEVTAERVVALGGGRVIDVAKAIVSARAATGSPAGAARAMAIPTTLSGAEMTRGHRRARGAPQDTPGVRPAVVVNDPALSASQPLAALAASALNALGHAAEGPCTPRSHPVAALAALESARRLTAAFARPAEPDRESLALGALLAGYTIDSTGYGLHHVLSQTLVGTTRIGHAQANAIMLPHTLSALSWRFPARYDALGEAVGGDPAEVAARLCALTGHTQLRELGVEPGQLDECADAAAQRDELELTPPRADRAELRALYEHAR